MESGIGRREFLRAGTVTAFLVALPIVARANPGFSLARSTCASRGGDQRRGRGENGKNDGPRC